MTSLHEPLHHAGAHPAQTDHSNLHFILSDNVSLNSFTVAISTAASGNAKTDKHIAKTLTFLMLMPTPINAVRSLLLNNAVKI